MSRLALLLLFIGFVLFSVHLGFSRAEFDLANRVLLVMPGLLLCYEINRYATETESRVLPFGVVALFYHYVYFSFPSLFEIDFYDLSGAVRFSEHAQSSGAVAVAMSCAFLYGGIRLGEMAGRRGRKLIMSLSPPSEIPKLGYRKAILAYGAMCFVVVMIQLLAPSLIPSSLGLLVLVTLSFDFAIGLVLARPEISSEKSMRNLDLVFVLLGGGVGLLRGILEPIIRLGVASFLGKWASVRKISYTVLATIIGIYVVLQPVKNEYRERIWIDARDNAGVSERLEAWSTSFSNFWSGDGSNKESDAGEKAVSRVNELDAVMHSFDMLPGRVRSLEGAGWLNIPVSFIPRFIWRDKPTTRDLAQRYAVEFHRQTEMGARSTAILLPLIIDGYWNFGWPGIAIASILMGLWAGIAQRLFAGEHWALYAMGIAHLARLSTQSSVTMIFSGLFQSIAGLLTSAWAIYWLAKVISNKEALKARRIVRFVPPRARRTSLG